MKRNALVAQSGGPSPVINASLLGVVEACFDYPDHIGSVFAGRHGVEGVLKEELIDMNHQDREELALLRTTPGSGAVGTCRYKLKDEASEDFDRLLDVLQAHDIGYFFYIGGNDSMDTAHKVSDLAQKRGYDLVAAGVPKTIDNDVGDPEMDLVDHTPGYGSTARYWAYITQLANEENRGMRPSESVVVLQAMGRSAGFIPAAARLADPDRRMPIQLYLAESDHTLESMLGNVNRELNLSGRVILIVSEGFPVGSLGERHDSFGHIEYGASRSTVAQEVINYLNDHGLHSRGQAVAQVPGILQRTTSIFVSPVDQEEAYGAGRAAVNIAIDHGTGYMSTIRRSSSSPYRSYYDKIPLDVVANNMRQLPPHWITKDQLDVTDDFIRYARPLIGNEWPSVPLIDGRQRFTELDLNLVYQKLAPYVPTGHR